MFPLLNAYLVKLFWRSRWSVRTSQGQSRCGVGRQSIAESGAQFQGEEDVTRFRAAWANRHEETDIVRCYTNLE